MGSHLFPSWKLLSPELSRLKMPKTLPGISQVYSSSHSDDDNVNSVVRRYLLAVKIIILLTFIGCQYCFG